MMQNRKNKSLFGITVVLISICLVLLCVIDLREILLQFEALIMLNHNLTFISKMIGKHVGVIIFVGMLLFVCWGIHSVRIRIPKITIGGLEISLNNVENVVKSNIKNYLSSKRSLYHCNEKYDNYYDVITSYYEIYGFLRKQLNYFDEKRMYSNQCFKNIEDSLVYLNTFLTKYQSDYRRWYLKKIEEDEFIPFIAIQTSYDKFADMKADFQKLNLKMKHIASFFDINTDIWESIFDESIILGGENNE